MTASYDDQLFIHYARNLVDGQWLGEYNAKTLSKGISYSLFLAFANKIQLPYSLLLGGFNILASVLITLSVKPIVKKNSILFFIYVFFVDCRNTSPSYQRIHNIRLICFKMIINKFC